MTREEQRAAMAAKVERMKKMDADGVPRKTIAEAEGISQARVTQALGAKRKYVKKAKEELSEPTSQGA